jgi:hypothetical protein
MRPGVMKNIFLAFMMVAVFAACSTDVKLALVDQEQKIDTYLNNLVSKDESIKVFRNKGVNRAQLEFIHKKMMVVKDTLIYGQMVKDTTYMDMPIVDTVSVEYGDSVYFYYAGYVFTSSPSALFTTNVADVARSANLDLSVMDTLPKGVLFQEGELIRGLEYGLHDAKEQEHCYILFSADYGFGNSKLYNIPKLSALMYEIVIDRVVKNDKEE